MSLKCVLKKFTLQNPKIFKHNQINQQYKLAPFGRGAKMVEAYLLMTVGTAKEHHVFETLKKMKEVMDVSILYGEWDIIAKVRTDRIEDLDPLVTGKIRTIPGVKTTVTMIVAKSTT